MSTSGYEIVVDTDPRACAQAWATLETEGAATPFQTRAWLLPWYDIVAPHLGATPLLVTVRRAGSREPLMLLPLCRRRVGALFVIEFADGGVSDYNAPLLAADFKCDDWKSLWRTIRAALPKSDAIRFEKLPATIQGQANPLLALGGISTMKIGSWDIALASSRAEQEKVTHTYSRELKRKSRRLAGRGEVRFSHAKNVQEAKQFFDALAAQRHERFVELGRDNILDDPVFRRFYETVIFSTLDRDLARVSALAVGDVIVAAIFALQHGDASLILMSTMLGGEWKSSSPGNLSLDRLMLELAEEGKRRLDFTIGDEPYKGELNAVRRTLYTVVQPLTLAGVPRTVRQLVRSRVRETLDTPRFAPIGAFVRQIMTPRKAPR